MRLREVIGISLVTLSGAAAAEAWRLPRHKTIEREEQGVITTVYPDLRTGGLWAQPVLMPTLGAGSIEVSYDQEYLARNNLVEGEEGQRMRLSLTARNGLNRWIANETTVGGVKSDSNPEELVLEDIRSVMTIQAMRRRYSGLVFELGVEVAVADGQDFDRGHQDAFNVPTYLAGVRYGIAVGMNVFELNLRGFGQFSGKTETGRTRTTEDGDIIPLGPYEHRYYEGDFALLYSYRIHRFVRAGAEGRLFYRAWEGEDDAGDVRDYGLGAIGFAEVTPWRWLRLRGGAGWDVVDTATREDRDWSQAIAYGTAIFSW